MHVDNSSSASNSVDALWTIIEIHLLPDTILGAYNIALNQTDKSPCLQVTYIITGEEYNSVEREREAPNILMKNIALKLVTSCANRASPVVQWVENLPAMQET